MTIIALVSLALAAPSVPHELNDYLARPDASFQYAVQPDSKNGMTEIQMTSQTWQGIKWQHTILIQQPVKVLHPGTAILFITGDGPRPGDYRDLTLVSAATGMPVAMLFNIPNQPLWDLKEDGLIAHTFQKYLETHDASWPLLFPMAKSAIRAMDSVEGATAKSNNPIHEFVVTGASKRGWTTWFVGASRDRRVKAIAPMVIDNLNLPAQMKHQMDSWGKYSEQIEDYTKLGLQGKMASAEGKRLGIIADPFSYRSDIQMPTLIVKGSNDPYWAVDALDMYWKDLKQPKWILNVPNAGHNLNGGFMAAQSIGAFARSVAGEFEMPRQSWSIDRDPSDPKAVVVKIKSNHPACETVSVWGAESDNLDFRNSKYTVLATMNVQSAGDSASSTLKVAIPSSKNWAIFAQMGYKIKGAAFNLSTPTKIIRAR